LVLPQLLTKVRSVRCTQFESYILVPRSTCVWVEHDADLRLRNVRVRGSKRITITKLPLTECPNLYLAIRIDIYRQSTISTGWCKAQHHYFDGTDPIGSISLGNEGAFQSIESKSARCDRADLVHQAEHIPGK
jgi:hypothetical protein